MISIYSPCNHRSFLKPRAFHKVHLHISTVTVHKFMRVTVKGLYIFFFKYKVTWQTYSCNKYLSNVVSARDRQSGRNTAKFHDLIA